MNDINWKERCEEAEVALANALADDSGLKEADKLMMKKLERIQELENINESHRKINGDLRREITVLEQEKMELLTMKQEISTALLDNKLMSREWIYDNIFDLNEKDKKIIFDGIVEDRKQVFRFEQIETEGNDPVVSGEKADSEADEMARRDGWGGDRRSGTGEKEYGNEYDAEDLKDATTYHRERNGAREFKGGSPLATSKGSTIVAREGLLGSLQKRFGKDLEKQSILNEEIILDEEE